MNRPDLKLIHDTDGLPVESLAAEYWQAAKSLRGGGDPLLPSDTAISFLHRLGRTCRHDRLRRAARGILTTLGFQQDGPNTEHPGPEAA